ncbi:hypothetical protein DFJ73DRAFT_821124 [Zopfochytrium polystomum]|nr:hypothetical protein DFJ73DRAFT_821124 [Zopfochytrium polystomum]
MTPIIPSTPPSTPPPPATTRSPAATSTLGHGIATTDVPDKTASSLPLVFPGSAAASASSGEATLAAVGPPTTTAVSAQSSPSAAAAGSVLSAASPASDSTYQSSPATATTPITAPSAISDSVSSSMNSTIPPYAIAILCIGGVSIVALLIWLAFYLCRRSRHSATPSSPFLISGAQYGGGRQSREGFVTTRALGDSPSQRSSGVMTETSSSPGRWAIAGDPRSLAHGNSARQSGGSGPGDYAPLPNSSTGVRTASDEWMTAVGAAVEASIVAAAAKSSSPVREPQHVTISPRAPGSPLGSLSRRANHARMLSSSQSSSSPSRVSGTHRRSPTTTDIESIRTVPSPGRLGSMRQASGGSFAVKPADVASAFVEDLLSVSSTAPSTSVGAASPSVFLSALASPTVRNRSDTPDGDASSDRAVVGRRERESISIDPKNADQKVCSSHGAAAEPLLSDNRSRVSGRNSVAGARTSVVDTSTVPLDGRRARSSISEWSISEPNSDTLSKKSIHAQPTTKFTPPARAGTKSSSNSMADTPFPAPNQGDSHSTSSDSMNRILAERMPGLGTVPTPLPSETAVGSGSFDDAEDDQSMNESIISAVGIIEVKNTPTSRAIGRKSEYEASTVVGTTDAKLADIGAVLREKFDETRQASEATALMSSPKPVQQNALERPLFNDPEVEEKMMSSPATLTAYELQAEDISKLSKSLERRPSNRLDDKRNSMSDGSSSEAGSACEGGWTDESRGAVAGDGLSAIPSAEYTPTMSPKDVRRLFERKLSAATTTSTPRIGPTPPATPLQGEMSPWVRRHHLPNTATPTNPPTHVAVGNYSGGIVRSDEIGLTTGDLVEVRRQFSDGWAFVVNLSQGKRRGVVPMARLKELRSGPSRKMKKESSWFAADGGEFAGDGEFAAGGETDGRDDDVPRAKKPAQRLGSLVGVAGADAQLGGLLMLPARVESLDIDTSFW